MWSYWLQSCNSFFHLYVARNYDIVFRWFMRLANFDLNLRLNHFNWPFRTFPFVIFFVKFGHRGS